MLENVLKTCCTKIKSVMSTNTNSNDEMPEQNETMTVDKTSSTVSSSTVQLNQPDQVVAGLTVPRVIRFAYKNFTSRSGKWSAKCDVCNKCLQDNAGVTTAFTR